MRECICLRVERTTRTVQFGDRRIEVVPPRRLRRAARLLRILGMPCQITVEIAWYDKIAEGEGENSLPLTPETAIEPRFSASASVVDALLTPGSRHIALAA